MTYYNKNKNYIQKCVLMPGPYSHRCISTFAIFLPIPAMEDDQEVVVSHSTSPRPDLMQTPLQDPDFILYTDGSDSVSLENAEDDAADKPPGISSTSVVHQYASSWSCSCDLC